MTRFALRLAALALLGAGTAGQASAQAQTEDAVRGILKDTHGDWEVRCAQDNEGACAIQQVGKVDGQDAMLVNIRRVKDAKDADGKAIPAIMEVIVPLGVLIPYGVRMKVDAGEITGTGLTRCAAGGCVARAPMSNAAVSQMKAGAKATFAFFTNQEQLIEVSLSGFTRAFNSIEAIALPQQPNR